MKLSSYLKSCSKSLLKELCKLSKDKKLVEYYERYDQALNVSDNVDYTWNIISSALLLSEHLWKNESVYQNISNTAIDNIEDIILQGALPVKGEEISNNCLLDSHNNVANSININDIQDGYLADEIEMLEYKINKKKDYATLKPFEQARLDFLDDIFVNDVYGANDALVVNDKLDYRKFIIRVRHALAHSNYEFIDDNFIRLYHYNREKKALDFNVALNKKLIITILDEINESFYESGQEFANHWNDVHREYLYNRNKYLDDEMILSLLGAYEALSKEKCQEILDKAKKHKDYKNSENADKLNIVFESFLEYIRPVCSYGIIVNEFLYGNNDGLIDEEYYIKLGLYNYFNSELFDINMDSNPKEYKKHKSELLLFSFLNSSLLNGVNLNNNEIDTIIDFSKMHIRDEDYKNATEGKSKLTLDLSSQIKSKEKELLRATEALRRKALLYNEKYMREEDYYKKKLPEEIYYHIHERARIMNELKGLREKLQFVSFSNLSNHILTHIRNCLAHGYIKLPNGLNQRDVCSTLIEFVDYNPSDKSEITFKGSIMFGDLLEILTNERYVTNVFGSKNESNSIIKK